MVDEYWDYHSTYRGAVIYVWLPDGTPFRTYLVDHEITLIEDTLSELHARIDAILDEPYWELYEIYRDFEIWVDIPARTLYAAEIGGVWKYSSLAGIRLLIDNYLDPEDVVVFIEPPFTGALLELRLRSYDYDELMYQQYSVDGVTKWPQGTFTGYDRFQVRFPPQTKDGVPYLEARTPMFYYQAKPHEFTLVLQEEVGEPYTQVTDFIVPESLPAGATIGALTVVAKNAGTAAGYLEVAINSEHYTEVIGASTTQVAIGGTFTFNLTLGINTNMPNEDFTLTATNLDGTSYITKTILLQVGIPTTLTISAPDKAGVAEKFMVSGILYETESGIPIPNQPINHSYDGKSLGSSITGIDGDYLKEVSIPEAGVWTLRSDFLGTETLQASQSQADAIVAATPLEAAIAIIGSAATGLAMILYGLS